MTSETGSTKKPGKYKSTSPASIPRLTVEITQEQSASLRRYLRQGDRTRIFQVLIDQLILMLEHDAAGTMAAIMTHAITVENMIMKTKEQWLLEKIHSFKKTTDSDSISVFLRSLGLEK
uniref:Uncharacterized protein n=1 Tax=viral metagenome TaxID=1070528 RepID=A0A6M3KRL1_9ZZZZ